MYESEQAIFFSLSSFPASFSFDHDFHDWSYVNFSFKLYV